MTIQRLPLEIIQKIFEYTDPKEADQCLYLCKAWYPVLRSVYFKEITWSINGLKKLKEKLSNISETTNSLELMPFTKQIKIYNDVDRDGGETDIFDDEGNYIDSVWTSLSTQLTEKEFILLLSHFPNLECLDLQSSTHSVHYTKILVNYQGCEKLPPLEDIKMARVSGPELCRLNFSLGYRFRHSLKAMTIKYVKDLDDGSSLLKSLSDFISLKSLVVEDPIDSDLTLFHLLRACPNVPSVTYDCHLKTPIAQAKELAIFDASKEELSLLKNLTHIKLVLPTITSAYMDFFANHSPKTLTSIKLYAKQTTLYDWIDTVSMDVALKFCKSLQKFTAIKMKFTHYNRDSVVGVEAGRASMRRDSQIDIFYHILDSLTEGRDVKSTKAIYSSRYVAEESFHVINGLGLTYQYGLEEFGPYNRLGRKYQECTLPVPSSSSSLKQLSQLKQMTAQTGYGDIDSLPTKFLDFVKRYCPELRHFELQPQMIGRHLQADCRGSFNSSLEDTTHVFMKGAQFSQALFDSVNEYFPRVKSLDFGINTRTSKPVADLVFNLSSFKHLETFIINIEERSVNAGDLIFIVFQYTGSKSKMQHLVKKVPEVLGCNGGSFEFQFVSNCFLQEKSNAGEEKRAYIIHIEGLPQLANIQIKNLDSATSTLDLSYMLNESF